MFVTFHCDRNMFVTFPCDRNMKQEWFLTQRRLDLTVCNFPPWQEHVCNFPLWQEHETEMVPSPMKTGLCWLSVTFLHDRNMKQLINSVLNLRQNNWGRPDNRVPHPGDSHHSSAVSPPEFLQVRQQTRGLCLWNLGGNGLSLVRPSKSVKQEWFS